VVGYSRNMWIDAHSHLDQVLSPVQSIEEAIRNNVRKICIVSETFDGMQKVMELKHQFPDVVVAGLGLHPQYFADFSEDIINKSMNFIVENSKDCSMIGEIGLDYKYATEPHEKEFQKNLLQKQIELATKLQLPLNLHSRRSERDTMNIAIDYKKKTGYNSLLHWFTNSKKLVKQATDNGVFVSAGPSVIVDPQTKEVVKAINLNFLLLETDSPVEYPGLGNADSSWIFKVGKEVSALLNMTENHLQDIVQQNFERYINNR